MIFVSEGLHFTGICYIELWSGHCQWVLLEWKLGWPSTVWMSRSNVFWILNVLYITYHLHGCFGSLLLVVLLNIRHIYLFAINSYHISFSLSMDFRSVEAEKFPKTSCVLLHLNICDAWNSSVYWLNVMSQERRYFVISFQSIKQ